MKILLVESEVIVAIDIAMKLESRGFEVVSASTGEQALESITAHKPDLILTAIQLKGKMNGIELARFTKEKHNIPLIYITALDYMKNDPQLMATLPVGVLGKPVADNNLFDMIDKAL
jgi:CheY-like chemotaxis protein